MATTSHEQEIHEEVRQRLETLVTILKGDESGFAARALEWMANAVLRSKSERVLMATMIRSALTLCRPIACSHCGGKTDAVAGTAENSLCVKCAEEYGYDAPTVAQS